MNARILERVAASTLAAMALVGCTQSEAQSPDQSNTQTETSNSPAGDNDHQRLDEQLTNLEDRYDARVGVSALDTETDEAVDHRADERFGFASTLKVFAVAELLGRTKPDDLEKNVTWTQADVDEAGWTPVTEKHVDDGLPLDDVAESALRVSDNLAMNIVLNELGGPEALDDALEEAGDTTTEVTDEEPALNDVEDGSTDNTTTPAAFTAGLQGLLDPQQLSDEDRELLLNWMSANETGDPLIRAGAPEGWVVRDKSGHSDAIQNDIAVVTPPDRQPIVISVMTETDDPESEDGPALVAAAAEIVLDRFQ
ncbi:class A beta-lactamase [Brevibacterium permense]|uniref:class A beta-lactamase n=1 Tax=Brevibacterium permense TaxID=234834 RepID=UPI0021D39649|nr:class A beta-lactamase [Brevibacterium permense]MCU4299131.1 class A beta-lactamase [Brevibacterium permense]